METDDRVRHELFGTGTITDELADHVFMVRFDINPSEWNISRSPCLIEEELYKQEDKYGDLNRAA